MTRHDRHLAAQLTDGGFRSLGEFLIAVRAAEMGSTDPRLARLTRAPTGGSEVDPTGGGFLVPEVFSDKIIGSIYEASVLAPLCDITETTKGLASFKEPAFDEISRQDGSRWGGTLGYWLAEAATIPLSKPKYRQNEFSTHKLIVLTYLTEELFQDAGPLEAHFGRAAKAEGSFKLDLAILAGTGAGTPMGILNSGALITVAKQPGQLAGTIVAQNVNEMWRRMPGPSRRRAVWLVNEDADEQLSSLAPGASPMANGVAYIPAGVAGNAFPLLKGRPVLEVEQASALGQVGDIVLADLQSYRIVQGAPGFAVSADVAFLTDELAFRFTFRVDGKPSYTSPITPWNGTNTRSPFVTLAAR